MKLNRMSLNYSFRKQVPDRVHHFFVIHSPLALLMMFLIAKAGAISPGSMSAVLLRNQPDIAKHLASRGVRYFWGSADLIRSSSFSERQKLNTIRDFDRELKRIVKRRGFNLYTFDSVSGVNQLASTHPLCRSTSIFEEGIANMRPIVEQVHDHFIDSSRQPLYVNRFRDRFFSTGLISTKVENFFSFSSQAFPDANPTNVFDRGLTLTFASETRSELVVLIPEDRALADGTLRDQLSKFLHERLSAGDAFSFKFHPASTPSEEEYWEQAIQKLGFEARKIKSGEILEANLAANQVGEIAGWGSSLLVYAQELGVKVTNLDNSN